MIERGQPQSHTLPANPVKQRHLRSKTHTAYLDSINAFKASITTLNAKSYIVLYDAPLPAIDKSTGSKSSATRSCHY